LSRTDEVNLLTDTTTRQFRERLLQWFDENARDLPWRRTKDPYRIWLSEVMLQQTRVAAVLEHYAEFLRRFPTLKDLASASEADVLAAWSGLGYYRRVRMMHQAAQKVVDELDSTIPNTAEELRKLPGIGEYTSAAIASIAFGEPIAVVDGNVERVVTRLRGLDGPEAAAAIKNVAVELLDPLRPGDFNQAMMELGATVCLPRNPLCLNCPVQSMCATRGEHPTTPRAPMQTRDVAYALVQRRRNQRSEVLLEQRSSTVMDGMFELPEIQSPCPEYSPILRLRHAIMQTNYRVMVCSATQLQAMRLRVSSGEPAWFTLEEIRALPLTGLARKILKRVGLLPPVDRESTVTSDDSSGEPSESAHNTFPV
jgi:A/G-specific adenine glycosylase